MIDELIIPQIERFTTWLESRGISPVELDDSGRFLEIRRGYSWSEIVQKWYREMESFS
jgi:hypothetical protein